MSALTFSPSRGRGRGRRSRCRRPSRRRRTSRRFLRQMILAREHFARRLSGFAFELRGLERLNERGSGFRRLVEVVEYRKPVFQRRGELRRDFHRKQLFGAEFLRFALLFDGEEHSEAELGVVLKERVRPRGAFAGFVLRVGDSGHRAAPGLRASGRVGPETRSPKSCVMSFAYGVSPQPAQAAENSRSGWRNWLPLTVHGSKAPSLSLIVRP